MRNYILIAASVALASCGGGDSSSGGSDNGDAYDPQPVSYSVDPKNGPTCNRASDISEFTSGSYTSIDCTWFCGTDDTYDHQYVSIDFVKSGGTWKKNHVYVSSGICR